LGQFWHPGQTCSEQIGVGPAGASHARLAGSRKDFKIILVFLAKHDSPDAALSRLCAVKLLKRH
jgi:hypothetical protein